MSDTFPEGALLGGRYRVCRFLARGAQGEVYEVDDLTARARVALKTIRPELAADTRSVERLRRELALSRRITHPNVCRFFDIGEHVDGGRAPLLFLTMELLEGETLSRRLRAGGRLAWPQALPLARQLCAALHAAHEVGVVHRDFKSGNVMLVAPSPGERAVVTDFGLAWSAAPDGEEPQSVTHAGGLLGTPDYMAPEQIEGRPVTPATDVYALGVVLYEMLCGVRPFTGETPFATILSRFNQPPVSPRRHAPDLPRHVAGAVLRCLEVEPRRRFQDAEELLAALESPAPARRLPLLAAGLAAALAGGAAWMAAGWSARPASVAVQRYEEGQSRLRLLDSATARRLLGEAVAADPSLVLARSALAEAWLMSGHDAEALDQARIALDQSSNLPARDRLLVEGRYHWLAGERERALALFARLHADEPSDLEAGLHVADAQVQLDRPAEALQTTESLRALPAPAGSDPRIDLLASRAERDATRKLEAASRAAERAAARGGPILQAWALLERSRALGELGRRQEAFAALDEALEVFERQRDLLGKAVVLTWKAGSEHNRGDYAASRALFEEALATSRLIGNRKTIARSLGNLADSLYYLGRLPEATRTLQEAVDLNRTQGNRALLASNLTMLARSQLAAGNLAAAALLAEEGLQVARGLEKGRHLANAATMLAQVRLARDELPSSRAALEEALPLFGQGVLDGWIWGGSETGITLARLYLAERRLADAVTQARQSLADSVRFTRPEPRVHSLVVLSRALRATGDAAEAARSAGDALALASQSQDAHLQIEAALEQAAATGATRGAGDAAPRLEAAISRARQSGLAALELEGRLELGLLQASGGRSAAGRARLEALAREAAALGFAGIARRARLP